MSTAKFQVKAIVAVAVAGLLALSGCSSSSAPKPADTKSASASATPTETKSETKTADTATFPMEFKNADGTTTKIPAKPKRIVSTSVTLTGMAMPFKAPIVASATAINSKFFPTWGKAAMEAKVKPLWPAKSPANLEAVTAAKPDLILVSSFGADSVRKQVADLQKIAPTVVIDASKQSWEAVTKQLGQVTGMTKEANDVVDQYTQKVKDLAAKIKHPEGTVNILSYNGPSNHNAIAQAGGPYGKLFSELGFKVEDPKKEWDKLGTEGGHRTDFVFTSLENLTQLKSPTTFLIHADDAVAQKMMANKVLANVPSVKAKQVYPLGKMVFRLDYYSSQMVLKKVEQLFAK